MKKIIWTSEIDIALRTLQKRKDNLSYTQIAKRMTDRFGLPFTRNACIGRAHRMDLPPRITHRIERMPKSKVAAMTTRIDTPILPMEARRPIDSRELTIYQLREGDCRYPSGEDRPPYTYCGAACEIGISYCPDHARIVFKS